MKRVIIAALLVVIAAVVGIVRSGRGVPHLNSLPEGIAGESNTSGDVREEIRKNFDLSPGAHVLVSGINGPVNIETADVKTAEIYIERFGKSQAVLDRRKIMVDCAINDLTIRGKSGDVGLFARIFGSNPTEKVTLKIPKQVSLTTEGVNGSVIVGEVNGPVEARGVNGKVNVASATGKAEFHGVNGNIMVGLKSIDQSGVSLNGVNGNIELRLGPGVNVELEARGMNGNVDSSLPDFALERARHGSYSARVGNGGSSISAHGINGNITFTR
jgi:hypothetical protein